MSLDFLSVLLPMLLTGLKLTLIIAVLGIVFAFVIGSLIGYALQCKIRILKWLADAYIWVIRGVPLIVLALYVYYVLPKIVGSHIPATTVGIIVISLNAGAFIAEIVRSALQGVPVGQREAGLSLGLSPFQTLVHIIIPPAFRAMLPALCNQFIIAVKDTALLSVITVNEITHQAQNYAAMSFNTIPAYTVLALFYLAIISVLILLQKAVEKRMGATK
ncbi:MAG TPA: amino acid ABC transporter permease [Papillibacter sp.]|jgi:glutamine transport system permease protein|nr:amino acid ABC transporter permease [Papillibacter sp.]